MSPIKDPKANTLHTILSGIYGRAVPVEGAPKLEPSSIKACPIAIYVDNQEHVVGLLLCSMGASAYLGAALSLLPKPVADESIRKGALDEGLLENFQEVANICSSLFTEYLGSRVHLKGVVAKATAIPPELKAFAQSALRTDLTIEVPSYGSGQISIRIAKAVAT